MTPSPTERILGLAAYLDEHRRDDVDLDAITRDVPGYRDVPDAPALERHSKEWESVRKKLQRDLDDLDRQWGIVVEYDTRADCYRLASSFLTARRRAALISAAAVVAVEGLDAGEPGAIGSGVDDATARVVVQVHAHVGALRDAIDARTRVQFRHEGRFRTLDPWALGVWRGKWYVAGGDPAHDGAMRRFRLDRMDRIEPIDDRSDAIPDWFDVDKAFDFDPNSWGGDPPRVTTVRVEPDHLRAFVDELGGEVAEHDGGRGAIVTLTVRHYESFRNRVLGFRGHAVVTDPPEMVAVVRDHLAAIVAGSA